MPDIEEDLSIFMVFMSNKRIWIKEEYVWYAIGKIWPFRQEIKFSPKKNPKIMNNFSDMLALEGAGAKLVTSGQLLGYACKLGGITVQN